MNTLEEKIAAREAAGRMAIKQSLGTAEGESETASFISHHLEELGADYWIRHTGTSTPAPSQVLGILELRGHWGPDGGDELTYFDFTLPGDVTDYVLCVRFDDEGAVEDLSMES